jgi:hypothetical protein
VVQRWATGCMIDGSSPRRVWEFFSSPLRPHRLWDPTSFLFSGYHGLCRWGKAAGAWSWPLAPTRCRVQERMELYVHSPNTPSWRGTQLNLHRDNCTFYLYLSSIWWNVKVTQHTKNMEKGTKCWNACNVSQWYSTFFPPVPLETLFHSTLYPQSCWCIIQVIHNYI